MRNKLLALVIFLSFAFLLAGCTGGGNSVNLQQAQIAYAAALLMGIDALSLTSGTEGVDWVDNGTTVGSDMKRRNLAGTLSYERNPDVGYPSTETLTGISYSELGTEYMINGPIVGVYTDASHSTSTFNLAMSHSMFTVSSISGTLTTASGVTTGSLSFNGVSYSYAELTTSP